MEKITFGILALNAQPFLEYNLRALYPFAHQIIVVEGATRPAASLASANGHSVDDTVEMLERFQQQSDPEHKVRVISAIDDGYSDGLWPEKDEMSRAYAKRATGNWLWQVDSDEFYLVRDLQNMVHLLESEPEVSGISFPFYEFWGGFDYVARGPWYLYEFTEVPRLFRWGAGYSYQNHRPPTVSDQSGRPPDPQKWLGGKEMKARGIFLYHYSYVFPKQAEQKVGYYSQVKWTKAFSQNSRWMCEEYLGLKHPMFLSDRGWPLLQWLERYSGEQPEGIVQLRLDLKSGKVKEPVRATDDIERLLVSPLYYLERVIARFFLAIFWPLRRFWKRLRTQLLAKSSIASKIP